jgi:hypothetical protein
MLPREHRWRWVAFEGDPDWMVRCHPDGAIAGWLDHVLIRRRPEAAADAQWVLYTEVYEVDGLPLHEGPAPPGALKVLPSCRLELPPYVDPPTPAAPASSQKRKTLFWSRLKD